MEWLTDMLSLDDSNEALNIATQLCQYGYIFPVTDTKYLSVKDDGTLYRFQVTNICSTNLIKFAGIVRENYEYVQNVNRVEFWMLNEWGCGSDLLNLCQGLIKFMIVYLFVHLSVSFFVWRIMQILLVDI